MKLRISFRSTFFILLYAILMTATLGVGRAWSQSGPPPLVSPAWLRSHLHEKNLVVLDVYLLNTQKRNYTSGHVPGAVFTAFFKDGWRTTIDGVPGQLPAQEHINKVIGDFGIDPNSHVVLVPGGGGPCHPSTFSAATWIYWALNAMGQHKVSILNGGDDAWQHDKADPIETGSVSPKSVQFDGQLQEGYLATTKFVIAAMKAGHPLLVDARPGQYYIGRVKSPATVQPGTIPGAVSLSARSLLTFDGQGLLSQNKLRKKIADAMIAQGEGAIVFSSTSYLASVPWFVLHELEHHAYVLLYNGSMAAWTQNPSLPVVREPRDATALTQRQDADSNMSCPAPLSLAARVQPGNLRQ